MSEGITYYDGTKVLSLKDIDGKRPEIYMIVTNRTGGKTTFYGRLVVNRFIKKHEKFILLYRYKYELEDISVKFFNDLHSLFFPTYYMTEKWVCQNSIVELFLNKKSCGYAICLNSADQIKKYSHVFSDVTSMVFDEFQSETGNYCTNEITKFQSIHTSIARGQGKQSRYVPVYMLSNPVSLINPYYVAFGIHTRLDNKTRYLKGEGFILERDTIESAKNAQKESAFNRAFGDSAYNRYSSESKELLDNYAFIIPNINYDERPHYVATLRYDGKNYSIKEYKQNGIVYVDDKVDTTFSRRISVTTDDHQINYIMLRMNDAFISTMRSYFEQGCVRFKNLLCKQCFLELVAIR